MIKQKLQLLSPQEQRLLFIGSLLILLFSGYFYIWKPYSLMMNDYTQKIQSLQTDIVWLKQIKKQLSQIQVNSGKRSASNTSRISSLIDTIDKSIKRGRMDSHLDTLKKSGNGQVIVVFDSIEFDTLIKWLIANKKSGIQLQNADIQKTDTKGLVNARLSLRAGKQP